jgi:hypothetical protein
MRDRRNLLRVDPVDTSFISLAGDGPARGRNVVWVLVAKTRMVAD